MELPGPLVRLSALDHAVSRRFVAKPASRRAQLAVGVVHKASQTGSYGVGWVLVFAVVVTYLEGWRVALVAAACVIGTLLINTGIKVLLRRPRPWFNPIGDRPTTFSFPSAHTSMAVVGASSMTLVAPEAAVLWWGWAVVLATSRIILGMHYVGDVIAGVGLGALLSWLAAQPLLELAGAG